MVMMQGDSTVNIVKLSGSQVMFTHANSCKYNYPKNLVLILREYRTGL